ncbi:LURP-one-related protein [Dioscorea alata]|uniref:LURP-one-related protein n=1 Tax=Dioscorea alata TaxID=55571 RepID=A0ACB7U867_DIOAL|nr:LURP-one-related protein [Dioscorea alata]
MGGNTNLKPIVSKTFCSSSDIMLMVRKRPQVINGGGFVVMNLGQKVVFSVDGCGIIGSRGELIVRDGDGSSTLFIHKKGGIVQALSFEKKWRGYSMGYEGTPNKPVFTLREQPRSCIAVNSVIKVSIEPKEHNKYWDYEVRGSFMDKSCTINDRRGDVIAEVGVKELMNSKDLYYVLVKAGYDQAFVVGVIAVLDNIHGESTRC